MIFWATGDTGFLLAVKPNLRCYSCCQLQKVRFTSEVYIRIYYYRTSKWLRNIKTCERNENWSQYLLQAGCSSSADCSKLNPTLKICCQLSKQEIYISLSRSMYVLMTLISKPAIDQLSKRNRNLYKHVCAYNLWPLYQKLPLINHDNKQKKWEWKSRFKSLGQMLLIGGDYFSCSWSLIHTCTLPSEW